MQPASGLFPRGHETRVGPRQSSGQPLPRAAARALRVRLRRSYVAPRHSLFDEIPSGLENSRTLLLAEAIGRFVVVCAPGRLLGEVPGNSWGKYQAFAFTMRAGRHRTC
jgi:hypothetical protein